MSIALHPKYESYKDTGVAWLGSVPCAWEITRLGSVFTERRTKVSDKDYEPLSVTKNGILQQLDSAAKTNDGDNRKLVKKGDFVINSRSDRKGSSGVSPLDGSVSLINIVLKPNGIQPAFCNYILKSYAFVEEYYRMGHGIVADLWTTRYDEMRAILMALPSTDEQCAIAAFLDEKCAKIDGAVKIKEDQIALLRERRQIIIQDAVTRGLNPAAPMKESGIDWIGHIPAHWDVRRNFTLFRESKRSGNANLPVLSVSIHSGVSTEELSEEENIRSAIKIEDRTSYKEVLPGFVAYNMMRAWQGGIGSVSVHGMVSPAYVVAEPIAEVDAAFFELLYRTPVYIWQMDAASKGITDFRKRLYWDDFRNLVTILPPMDEQREIIQSITSMTAKINSGISIKESQIAALKEYKASLINAAVTGKIQVI
jgi:type I restriction enzyme S subunit